MLNYYTEKLKNDLVEQFKDKPVINALMETVGEQLTDLSRFFEELKENRSLQKAKGKQLDGIGNTVVLSRKEAGELACINESVYVLTDEEYRKYLMYKIWKNNCNCTYSDIIKSFRMFWDKPLYYSEKPEYPATMVFESSILAPEDNASRLLSIPLVKAAGVGILLIAYTVTPEMSTTVTPNCVMPMTMQITELPEIKFEYNFEDTLKTSSASENIMQTRLPELEFKYDFNSAVVVSTAAQNIIQTVLSDMEEV